MKRIRKGDRVVLTHAVCSPSPSIPLWGSQYECVGTSRGDVEGKNFHIAIDWDNGRTAAFFLYKLKLYWHSDSKKIDPNLAFLHRKRHG